MQRRVVTAVLITFLTLALFGPAMLAAMAAPDANGPSLSPGDWPTYLHDVGRSGFNAAETIINPGSAPKLKLHWTTSAGGLISVQPVEDSSEVYWGAWDGLERATALNGTKVWATNVGASPPVNCFKHTVGVASTATRGSLVINGTKTPVIFVGGGDDNFYALNAKTGAIIWKTPIGSLPAYYIWSSPAVYNGSVYIGVASLQDCPLVQGQLRQFNAATGQLQHTFNLVPNGCTGASVWGSPAIDSAASTVYFVTGNPGSCSSAEPMAVAMVELRTSDLSLVGYWQVPAAEQIQDSDFGSTPTLFQATIGGTLTNLVSAVNKNGIYYAFKRDAIANGPVWRAHIAVGGRCPECGNGSISPSAWDGNKLYVAGGMTTIGGASCLGSLRALNPATGAFLWQHCLTASSVLGAVSVVPGVAFVSEGPHLVAVATASGKSLFDFNTGSRIYGAPSISNGVVYVGNKAGELSAFGL